MMPGVASFTISSAASRSAAYVLAVGLGLGTATLVDRAHLPPGVDHAPLVPDAAVGTAPGRLGSEVDAALAHHLAVAVGPALVVTAVHADRHPMILVDAVRGRAADVRSPLRPAPSGACRLMGVTIGVLPCS